MPQICLDAMVVTCNTHRLASNISWQDATRQIELNLEYDNDWAIVDKACTFFKFLVKSIVKKQDI
jgi:hypothetical protein